MFKVKSGARFHLPAHPKIENSEDTEKNGRSWKHDVNLLMIREAVSDINPCADTLSQKDHIHQH